MRKHPSFARQILCILLAVLTLFFTLPTAMAARNPDSSSNLTEENPLNLLLIGQDRREGETRARADTLILCSFFPKNRKIVLTSFLRDLYVQIPEIGGNRLNAAYAFGGMQLMKETFYQNFGILPEGCIEVDFSRFSQIIDALGGVTLQLRQDEADAINHAVPGTLTEGTHLLTGEQALAYSRIRNLDSDGDFSRAARQRRLLSSLLNSYRDAGLLKILSAVTDTLPLISSDLNEREILVLAAKLFPLLDASEAISRRIPSDGTFSYSTIRGMEVLIADMESVRTQLRDCLHSAAGS